MSGSSLVSLFALSPNRNIGRSGNHIIGFAIHCVVGQCSASGIADWFARPSTGASANYTVCYDGQIVQHMPEEDRSWCTSNKWVDDRVITIETACDPYEPYAVTEAAYEGLIKLVADCATRNGITDLVWEADESQKWDLSHQNMVVHRWYDNKSCPGTWLFNHMGEIARRVNELITPKPAEPTPDYDFIKKLEEAQAIQAIQTEQAKKRPKPTAPNPSNKPTKDVKYYKAQYRTYCQVFGWLPIVGDGETSGTIGQAIRVEAVQIKVPGYNVEYQLHCQKVGNTDICRNGETCGTQGKGLRAEAIRIDIIEKDVDIYYRAQLQAIDCEGGGWTKWCKNGEWCGTKGQKRRLEALQIKIKEKAS